MMADIDRNSLEDRLLQAWRQLCTERVAGGVPSQDCPEAIVVVRQTSAGKSVLVEALRRDARLNESSVVISPAELAALHPARAVVKRTNDSRSQNCVRSDAARLASAILDRTVPTRCNVLLECTFDSADSAERLVQWMTESGYSVQVIVEMMPDEISRPDNVRHRSPEPSRARDLRIADSQINDRMFARLIDAVVRLEQSRLCDVTVIDHAGTVVADCRPDAPRNGDALRESLLALRTPVSSGTAGDGHGRVEISSADGMVHPRLQAEVSVATVSTVQSPLNPGHSSEEQRRVEQRMQFVQKLRRCAEAEQHSTF